jgi:hypothetical protein
MTTQKKPGSSNAAASVPHAGTQTIPDEQHPDYEAEIVGEGPIGLTPLPDGPLPGFPPLPLPLPPKPFPLPIPEPFPRPLPIPFPPLPSPFPFPFPIRFCGAVSGRYSYAPPVLVATPRPAPGFPVPLPLPFPLINKLYLIARIDVDRFYPQHRISIEVSRLFPRSRAHAVAVVTSDQCVGLNHRIVEGDITYRDGDASLIQGTHVVFEARRGLGRGYGSYSLTLSGAGVAARTYALNFDSKYFDPVEFEVDQVANANAPTTTMDTAAHPNRPADLPAETISLATVYQRAGFDVTMSPNANVIPTADAGANGTWSDGEMHNAMVTYWSRFANNPQWAMWVLFAARHDTGRNLGGVMFDDIGPNHRQGTAIFTDSFIQDAPAGDPNVAAWRQRMVFWTAAHEMGHGFNLAHAWQKAGTVAQGFPGDPWIPLANAPESRSFMNYPFNVAGGQASFFSDFRFRFSDDELVFMRHAPRRFVQMGNSNWFVNHGFEAPDALHGGQGWTLAIRPNREGNSFSFMEPVAMEMKLTNTSGAPAMADPHLLQDGRHITVFVQRQGGKTRLWRAMSTQCHQEHAAPLKAGASLYGSHNISASTEGWLIDEPGFYKIQAAIDMGGQLVLSNVQRVFVAPSGKAEENGLAGDYFTEDVGRALVFGGAPALQTAMATLESVVARCPGNPAALHAAMALSTPKLRQYKLLDGTADRASMAVRSVKPDVDGASKVQIATLTDAPDKAAETLGHIACFDAHNDLAGALVAAGNEKAAKKVMQASVTSMKKRGVLGSVVQATENRIAQMK